MSVHNDKSAAVQQLALSVFAVAGSAVTGMYITAKKEQTKLKNVLGAGSPAIIATKALLIGSAYAFGTFTCVTSLFIVFTGIRSFGELTDYVDKTFRTPEGYRRAVERRNKEKFELESLHAKYPHLNNWDLFWKQLRLKEDLQDESDDIDDKIVSGDIVLAPAGDPVSSREDKKKYDNSIFHVAYSNLQKLLRTIIG
jgi:hypothetical protein